MTLVGFFLYNKRHKLVGSTLNAFFWQIRIEFLKEF